MVASLIDEKSENRGGIYALLLNIDDYCCALDHRHHARQTISIELSTTLPSHSTTSTDRELMFRILTVAQLIE